VPNLPGCASPSISVLAFRCTRSYDDTVRDNLFRMSQIFGQHPPFFSKMRTFFKTRPRWYKLYRNFTWYHRGRYLSYIFKNKFFFLWGFLIRSVGASKLFVLCFHIHPGFIQPPYKMAIFKCP
jgi:hypothetical protein